MGGSQRRYSRPRVANGKSATNESESTFLPSRLSHLRGPLPNIPDKVPKQEMCTGVQVHVDKVIACDTDAMRDKCLFILRLSCAFHSMTKHHDEIATTRRGTMWYLIRDIRKDHKLRVKRNNASACLLELISPCEPLDIELNDDTLSLCMQTLETSMDDDGLLDATVYFATLNVAWTGTMKMSFDGNISGYNFYNRLLRLLLESVELEEPHCRFFFKPQREQLRCITEICKMQEECNYSLRFNCGGYGFSKLMWSSLKTSTKFLLNPSNIKRFNNTCSQK